MRLGIGLGLFKSGLISAGVRIFSAFQTRVIGDGGTVEAGTCVVNAINSSALLQQASLLLIPSGYKGGKLYAEIPTNGNGDLTWTRGGTANRTNSSGNIELMATGVPRLDYTYGSCPAVLVEPQRTNSIRNSTMVGAVTGSPGTLPTNWTNFLSGLSQTVVGVGTENGISYVDLRFNGTASGSTLLVFFETANFTSASSGQSWTLSNYIKLVSSSSGANSYNLLMYERTAVGGYVTEGSATITPSTTLERFVFTRTLTGGVTVAYVQPIFRCNLTSGNSYDFTIRIAQPQMELGAYATTAILTTGSATATRVADSFSRNNIYTNGLITSSGGTWFVELRGNVQYTRDAFSEGIRVADVATGSNNGFEIRNEGGFANLRISKRIAGASTTLFSTSTSTVKIAIKWNGTTADVFVNGTKQVSATTFTTTNMEFLACGAADVPKFIQQMALYPSPLSDTDCATLTTL